MNKKEIENILPHRNSMLLLDEVIVDDNNIAHGIINIRGDEWFLDGHFPENPVVPGVVQCEMLAQSVCVLMPKEKINGCTPYFTGLNNVKFKNPVKPGDKFETECEIVKEKVPFVFAKGKGYVNGKLCVVAEFSFALIK
ncbi:3-hydroxyacyl-ACP dehydratase FabZ [Sedimentibacter sp. zth1]|uniref:3-hydroxyacyl-ACP dehydratase FabZ n=1 Tax=Sedimentibacter sp. zth1 TaxID=2816908 RepID=UPI001A934AC5|nr:3-hydroxyacyl-ACP dehydratase FabZ [Sedimentibacter sp. zth1]QSX05548.1 3-hydroxyacyl-ACP dehydratase FabZ [Sedimentibacter sp. zth1]